MISLNPISRGPRQLVRGHLHVSAGRNREGLHASQPFERRHRNSPCITKVLKRYVCQCLPNAGINSPNEALGCVHFPSSPGRFLLDPTRKKLFGLLRGGDRWSQQRNKTKCETSDHRHKEEAIGVAKSCNLLLPGSRK